MFKFNKFNYTYKRLKEIKKHANDFIPHAVDMSRVFPRAQYLREFRTFTIGLPRQCGKTTAIGKFASGDSDILVVTRTADEMKNPVYKDAKKAFIHMNDKQIPTGHYEMVIFDDIVNFSDIEEFVIMLDNFWRLPNNPIIVVVNTSY